MKTSALLAVLFLALPLCAAKAKKDEAPGILRLEGSVAALRDAFNARKGRPRFLALLSPT